MYLKSPAVMVVLFATLVSCTPFLKIRRVPLKRLQAICVQVFTTTSPAEEFKIEELFITTEIAPVVSTAKPNCIAEPAVD